MYYAGRVLHLNIFLFHHYFLFLSSAISLIQSNESGASVTRRDERTSSHCFCSWKKTMTKKEKKRKNHRIKEKVNVLLLCTYIAQHKWQNEIRSTLVVIPWKYGLAPCLCVLMWVCIHLNYSFSANAFGIIGTWYTHTHTHTEGRMNLECIPWLLYPIFCI